MQFQRKFDVDSFHFICLSGLWCFRYAFCINWRICLLVSKHDFHIRSCSRRFGENSGTNTAYPPGVTLVVFVLPNFKFSVSCCSILSFLCSVMYTIICPFLRFSFGHSFLLWSTASDHPLHILINCTTISG